MVNAVKTICAEACFLAWLSNKYSKCNISHKGNIDGWLQHDKIYSFKTKKSIVARFEYMNNSIKKDSINNQFIKLFWFSWSANEITKYLLSKRKLSL